MEYTAGTAVSPGIAIGRILVLEREEPKITMSQIAPESARDELKLLQDALEKTRGQIQNIYEGALAKFGNDKAAIFTAHLDIVSDPALFDSVEAKISSELKNAAWAFDESVKEFCALFETIDDEYLRERASDVRDVGDRVLRNIQGIKTVDLSQVSEETLIAARDLLPSDTASMNIGKVAGFVTELGGRTSHTSIMARSLEIPAVVGAADILSRLRDGDCVIIDGSEGRVYINPPREILESYREKKADFARERAALAELKNLPAVTLDGKRVEMCANIGNVKDADGAVKNGAEGIGLYRTEFLYMDNKQFPTEEEQFAAYKEVCERMGERPVIIRTLDIGGDKELPYCQFPHELNPFLGWRAIRMSFDREDLFRTQLRAILRASAFGPIKIMFPMIISLEEFRKARNLTEECKAQLRSEDVPFDENIALGMMVETPAAVLLADQFAREADFFSIGTNDLTQYILAVDRGNETIAHLYNSLHPAVLSAIQIVIDASHRAGKWTGMCGELAGEKEAALLLLGMGLDEFSMSAISIPHIKNLIRQSSFAEMRRMAEEALSKSTAEDVLSVVKEALSGIQG